METDPDLSNSKTVLIIIISTINCNLIECSSIFCCIHLGSAFYNKDNNIQKEMGAKILAFGIKMFFGVLILLFILCNIGQVA